MKAVYILSNFGEHPERIDNYDLKGVFTSLEMAYEAVSHIYEMRGIILSDSIEVIQKELNSKHTAYTKSFTFTHTGTVKWKPRAEEGIRIDMLYLDEYPAIKVF